LLLASSRAVLKLERRVSHEGLISVGGNLCSVPDATRKRIVEVHTLANEVQTFEEGTLIAIHPVLDGRRQRRMAPGHRKMPRFTGCQRRAESPQKWRRKIPQLGGMAISRLFGASVFGGRPRRFRAAEWVRSGLRLVADCLGDEIGVFA
jgi:Mu transposase, C-terminal domain